MTKSPGKFDPAVRPANATTAAKNVSPAKKGPVPNNPGTVAKGPNKGPNKANPAVVKNGQNPNRWNNNHNGYYYDHGRWHGSHYGHHHHDHDHGWYNSFWPFFAYAAISDWLWYRPFGGNYFGYYPYAGYYYQPEVVYVDNSAPAYVNASDGSATIEVRLPDPDAGVWIDDAETESRGLERRYYTPTLRAGSNYSYLITASWTEDGETRTVARQVPLNAGGRVMLDFTQTPSRLTVSPGRE